MEWRLWLDVRCSGTSNKKDAVKNVVRGESTASSQLNPPTLLVQLD